MNETAVETYQKRYPSDFHETPLAQELNAEGVSATLYQHVMELWLSKHWYRGRYKELDKAMRGIVETIPRTYTDH